MGLEIARGAEPRIEEADGGVLRHGERRESRVDGRRELLRIPVDPVVGGERDVHLALAAVDLGVRHVEPAAVRIDRDREIGSEPFLAERRRVEGDQDVAVERHRAVLIIEGIVPGIVVAPEDDAAVSVAAAWIGRAVELLEDGVDGLAPRRETDGRAVQSPPGNHGIEDRVRPCGPRVGREPDRGRLSVADTTAGRRRSAEIVEADVDVIDPAILGGGRDPWLVVADAARAAAAHRKWVGRTREADVRSADADTRTLYVHRARPTVVPAADASSVLPTGDDRR